MFQHDPQYLSQAALMKHNQLMCYSRSHLLITMSILVPCTPPYQFRNWSLLNYITITSQYAARVGEPNHIIVMSSNTNSDWVYSCHLSTADLYCLVFGALPSPLLRPSCYNQSISCLDKLIKITAQTYRLHSGNLIMNFLLTFVNSVL